MAGLVQPDDAAGMVRPTFAFQRFKHGFGGVQVLGILGAHQRQVNARQGINQQVMLLGNRPNLVGNLSQDTPYFIPFSQLQLVPLVVQVHNHQRLNKQSSPR